MPYYIGDVIKDKAQLIGQAQDKLQELGVHVRLHAHVDAILREDMAIRLSDGTQIPFDDLVIATGAQLIMPGIPGQDLEGVFSLRKLNDAIRIKSHLREKACCKVIIVGAGFIGMEMCEALHEGGMKVQLINQTELPVNRWDAELSKKILEEIKSSGVDFLPKREPIAIEKGTDTPLQLITRDEKLDADMILLAVGIKPNVQLAQDAGIRIGTSGAIAVDFSQHTSDQAIYAIGDCCEVFHQVSNKWVHVPLSDIARKQARVAGHVIGGHPMTYPGIVGAQSFRIFSLEVAATGIDEREAQLAGFHPVSHIYWGNAIGALMGQKPLGLKLVADKATGKLLGAQAVGETGVVSRINALSVALWSGLTIDVVGQLDFAYAPPFSGSWDAVHYAAHALQRKM